MDNNVSIEDFKKMIGRREGHERRKTMRIELIAYAFELDRIDYADCIIQSRQFRINEIARLQNIKYFHCAIEHRMNIKFNALLPIIYTTAYIERVLMFAPFTYETIYIIGSKRNRRLNALLFAYGVIDIIPPRIQSQCRDIDTEMIHNFVNDAVRAPEDIGLTQIQYASKYGFALRVHDLLQCGADPSDCVSTDPETSRLLRHARKPWSTRTHAYVFGRVYQETVYDLCCVRECVPDLMPLELWFLLFQFLPRDKNIKSGRRVYSYHTVSQLQEWRYKLL
jgi:hypothetical protein